jgi:predicted DNA-binding protein (UPF0251 family)
MTRKCAHGVTVRTTKVWNEACWRCREVRDAYERSARRIGSELGRRYRAGEFDGATEDHLKGIFDPTPSRYWGSFRGDFSDPTGVRDPLSQVWKEKRALGIKRRREEVEQVLLDGKLQFEPEIEAILAECREEFTDRQFQALVFRHGFRLTLQEAADVLGIQKTTFRKRLAQAEAKVSHLRGDAVLEEQRRLEAEAFLRDWAADDAELMSLALANTESRGAHHKGRGQEPR